MTFIVGCVAVTRKDFYFFIFYFLCSNPAGNRVMRGLCYSKVYVTNGLLPGYQIKILLSRSDDIAGARDLYIHIYSFIYSLS
jgi:hypothetical protein